MRDEALAAAGDALVTALTTGSPQATVASRTV
jgi:hypothetical protein